MAPSVEYNILTSSLQNCVAPHIAALWITAVAKRTFEEGNELEELLQNLCNAVITVATETPRDAQQPLVDILKAIQRDDLTGANKGHMCVIWRQEWRMWGEMPLFAATMREAWNRGLLCVAVLGREKLY